MTNFRPVNPDHADAMIYCVENLPPKRDRFPLTSEGYRIGILAGAQPRYIDRHFHRTLKSMGLDR